MSKAPLIARIILGLIFFVFGLNGFFNFIPQPQNMPESMMTFMTGMMATKYFFPLLKGTEVICGLLLLLNMYVPLSLIVLAPITLNIFMVHAFMAPDGIVMAIAIGVLQVYLAFFVKPYSDVVKKIFIK